MRGKTTDRELQLFACACCRRVWGHLAEEGRRAVEAAERFADGPSRRRDRELARACGAASVAACRPVPHPELGEVMEVDPGLRAAEAAASYRPEVEDAARYAARRGPASGQERVAQAALARDIFGNPFRPRLAVAPAWLAWDGGTGPRLARAAYDGRDFGQLPVLADALARIIHTHEGNGVRVRFK
jgi:hypothetical protein